jgi:hypothetical protein
MQGNTMTKPTIANSKSLGARAEDSKIEIAKGSVTSILKMAIERRKTDLEVLRKLASQVDTASPFLIQRFATAVDDFPDLVRKFVFENPWYLTLMDGSSEPIRLDEFLHDYISRARERRAQERAGRSRDEGHAA